MQSVEAAEAAEDNDSQKRLKETADAEAKTNRQKLLKETATDADKAKKRGNGCKFYEYEFYPSSHITMKLWNLFLLVP